MSDDKVIKLDKFAAEKIAMEDITVEERLQIVIGKAAELNPENIIVLTINEEGDGRLFHTQLESRFALVGALQTVSHWLISNGLTQATMD